MDNKKIDPHFDVTETLSHPAVSLGSLWSLVNNAPRHERAEYRKGKGALQVEVEYTREKLGLLSF